MTKSRNKGNLAKVRVNVRRINDVEMMMEANIMRMHDKQAKTYLTCLLYSDGLDEHTICLSTENPISISNVNESSCQLHLQTCANERIVVDVEGQEEALNSFFPNHFPPCDVPILSEGMDMSPSVLQTSAKRKALSKLSRPISNCLIVEPRNLTTELERNNIRAYVDRHEKRLRLQPKALFNLSKLYLYDVPEPPESSALSSSTTNVQSTFASPSNTQLPIHTYDQSIKSSPPTLSPVTPPISNGDLVNGGSALIGMYTPIVLPMDSNISEPGEGPRLSKEDMNDVIVLDSDESDTEVEAGAPQQADQNLGSSSTAALIPRPHHRIVDPIVTVSPSADVFIGSPFRSHMEVQVYVKKSLRVSRPFWSYLLSDEAISRRYHEHHTSEPFVVRPPVIVNHVGCLTITMDGNELTFEGLIVPEPRLKGRIINPRFTYVPRVPVDNCTTSMSSASFHEEDASSRRPLPLPQISVDNFSLMCLNPGVYVNDVVIDFFLTYLHYEVMSPAQRRAAHVFGCFFYNKLLDLRLTQEQRYAAVCSWTRRVNIFTRDFLFVPVLQSSHWFLCIICFPWLVGTVDYSKRLAIPSQSNVDNPGNKDTSLHLDTKDISEAFNVFRRTRVQQLNAEGIRPMPCILVFDSLTGSKHRALNVTVLREFLHEEWQKKYAAQHGNLIFTKDTIRGYIARVYTQKNGCDCGVFCLSYAEHFIRSPVKFFCKHHFEVTHLCPPERELDGAKLRAKIQDVIVEKFRASQQQVQQT